MPKKVNLKEDEEKIEQARKFGGWLRSVREGTGMSIEEAARKAGLSRETWTVCELGGRNVFGTWRPASRTPKTLRKMAQVLDMPEKELFHRAGVATADDAAWVPEASPAAAQLADLASQMARLVEEVRAVRAENAALREQLSSGRSNAGAVRKRGGSRQVQP